MLQTERVNKVFSPGIFTSKQMVTNMKFVLTNVPFRHDSTCVIQQWIRFERVVITVRLADIS